MTFVTVDLEVVCLLSNQLNRMVSTNVH